MMKRLGQTPFYFFAAVVGAGVVAIGAGLSACGGLAIFCVGTPHPDDPKCTGTDGGGDTGDTDEGTLEDGRWWCAEVPDPEAHFDPPQPHWEDITDPDNGGGDPKGCLCADEDRDDELDAILVNGFANVTVDDHGNDLVLYRNTIFVEAEERCAVLADIQDPNRDDDDCLTAIDRDESGNGEVTKLFPEGNFGDCSVGVIYSPSSTHSMPALTWSDSYTLSNVISQNPFSGVYEIDETFFLDMLDNAEWILSDGTRIEWNATTSAYELTGVSAGTIADALGLKNDDAPDTLNSIDVTTVAGALEAHDTLQTATSFTFVVDRAAGPATLNYSIIP